MIMIKKIWNFLHRYFLPIFAFILGLQPFFKEEVNIDDLMCYSLVALGLATIFKIAVYFYNIFKREFSFGDVNLKITKGDLLDKNLVLIPYIDNKNKERGKSLYSELHKKKLGYEQTDIPNVEEVCILDDRKFYCLKVMSVQNGGLAELTLNDFYDLCCKIAETIDHLSTIVDRETVIYIPNIASRYKILEIQGVDRIIVLMNVLSVYKFARRVNITLVLSNRKSGTDFWKFKKEFIGNSK